MWPPEVRDYNRRFTKTLELIKRRHDPTVTTVAQGVLEWKRNCNARNINVDVQHWLDRFYLSRIGIRFLIGQRTALSRRSQQTRMHLTDFRFSSDIALNTLQPHPDFVGIICTRSVSSFNHVVASCHRVAVIDMHLQNVHEIVHEAIENARYVLTLPAYSFNLLT